MNVLILTPDRVGSTLLQRLLTIYLLKRNTDKPTINLHELTNGIIRYYNQHFGYEVLGKPKDGQGTWGYWQTLPEIIDILGSVDHYKTSRLAHYHLLKRQDSRSDQLKFYDYLNKNFYVISCRRDNLFEHALSWIITGHSKVLNVYDPASKVEAFDQIYQNGITATQEGLELYLNRYKEYLDWVDTHFDVQSYFNYDKDVKNIEQYILGLDFMSGSEQYSWENMFGQDFNTWNTCHRLIPNIMLSANKAYNTEYQLTLSCCNVTQENWEKVRGPDWPEQISDLTTTLNSLPAVIQEEIKSIYDTKSVAVSKEHYNFLTNNISAYYNITSNLHKLEECGIMVTGVPIKLQSLAEKSTIIKNFDQCIDWYNQWVNKNNFGCEYTTAQLDQLAMSEETQLSIPIDSSIKLLHNTIN